MKFFHSLSWLLIGTLFFYTLPLSGQTNVTADISVNTVWNIGGSPYILQNDIEVLSGITLTVAPGVEVQFPTSGTDLLINGSLSAVGMDGDSIHFHGNSANSQGGNIVFNTGSTGTISKCIIEFMGSIFSTEDAAVVLREGATVHVEKSRFTANLNHIRAHPESVENLNNNLLPEVDLFSGTIDIATTWSKAGETSRYRLEGDIIIDGSITIQPGVNVFFPASGTDIHVNGTLSAVGMDSDSIQFNGNSANSQGGNIVFNAGSTGTIGKCVIEFMGSIFSTEDAAVVLREGATVHVEKSRFSANLNHIRAHPESVENLSNNLLPEVDLFSGTIDIATMWSKAGETSRYRLEGDIIVDGSITIQPGVNVFFPASGTDIHVNGTLSAVGMDSDSIQFNGSSGGNQGGNIVFNSSSTGTISKCIIEFMGSTFSSLNAAMVFQEGATVSVEKSRFSTNLNHIRAHPESVENLSNNLLPEVDLFNETIDITTSWSKAGETSQYRLEGDITLDGNLTIATGVKVLFPTTGTDLHVNGTLLAESIGNDSIQFCGSSSTNQGGNIVFNSNSTGTISKCVIEFMGSTFSTEDAAVVLREGAIVSIEKSRFSNNLNHIRAHPESVGGLSNNLISEVDVLFNTAIDIATTWPVPGINSRYRLEADLTIEDSLTIQPGVKVLFPASGTDIHVNGTLIAIGTSTDSICFFGNHANSQGGNIVFNSSSTGMISKCVIEFMGSTFSTEDAAVVLREGAMVHVKESRFSDNLNHIRAHPESVEHLIDNLISEVDLFAGVIDVETIWSQIGLGSRYRLEGDITVTDTLTIEAGTHILSPSSGTDIHVSGKLNAQGVGQDSIRFFGTSLGNQGGNVVFNLGSIGNIDKCVFEFLGSTFSTLDAAVFLNEGAIVTIQNSRFINNFRNIRAHPETVGNIYNNTIISSIYLLAGTINENVVWSKPGLDIVHRPEGDITIESGSTLTIEPGCSILSASSGTDIHVNGTLLATGTSADSIRFSGSSLGNQGGNLAFNGGSIGNIDKCVFEFLGSTFSTLDAAIFIAEGATVSLTKSRFNGNFRHIRAHPESVSGLSENDLTEVRLLAAAIDIPSIWSKPGLNCPYRLEGDVTANAILTLQPGVQVLSDNSSHDIIVNTTLLAEGTEGDTIRFFRTSGKGGNIRLTSSSVDSKIKHAIFENLGSIFSSADALLFIESSSVTVTKSLFKGSDNYGIRISNFASPVFTQCTITENPIGMFVESGNPIISQSHIFDNTSFGIRNTGAGIVTALNNWWGDPSGPEHPTTNPGGLGNQVSDNVLFDPWHTEPGIDCTNPISLTCGQTYMGSTAGDNRQSVYDCIANTYLGPEALHKITLENASDLVITLTTSGANMGMFLISDCCELLCMGAGVSELKMLDLPAGDYWLLVDGVTAMDMGSYTLDVNCATGLVCDTPVEIFCETPYSGTTIGAANNECNYTCTAECLCGGEVVHEIEVFAQGDLIATLSNLSADLDVLILDGCSNTCLAYGDNVATVTNAPIGTYLIVVEGKGIGTAGTYTLEVSEGFCLADEIGDYVWNDADEDGIQDVEESGIEGVTVQLFNDSDMLIQTVITDNNGFYKFNPIASGDYYAKYDPSTNTAGIPNYQYSPQNQGGDNTKDSDVNPTTGETAVFTFDRSIGPDLDLDAGFYRPKGTITGYVWSDLTTNGLQNNGEAPIEGVTVELYDVTAAMTFATVQTGSNGNYSIPNVYLGTYYVSFDASTNTEGTIGYEFTAQNQGNGSNDSDPDPMTGQTANFFYDPLLINPLADVDAGFLPPCTDDVVIDATFTPLSGEISAANSITIMGDLKVAAGSQLILNAPNVNLDPTFEVTQSAVLEVNQTGCSN